MSGLPTSGVIEGFYGPPWSWHDRHEMVAFLGQLGANTYVYAPKNDPLHRDRWREPYLPEEWARFRALAEASARVGVDLWFGLSPLGMRVSDPGDVAALVAKLEAADDAGIRRFCLLVDDMPEAFASSEDAERFASLAAAHVHLVDLVHRAVTARGADRRLWFVPLHYHGDPGQPYVREIGAGIHDDVAIMWTGPEVCSEFLTREHTEAVADSLRRPVLYWDNHPVNDGAMRHDPHLGPLRGRDGDLGPAAQGILSNVAIQPEASKIAVATFVRYASDPGSYDPELAWRRALELVTGDPQDADAVAVLADLARRSPLDRGDALANRLAGPLERCQDGWDSPLERRDRVTEVAEPLARLVDVARRLEGDLVNERLRRDLAPWSRKLTRLATAASEAVALVDAVLDDPARSDIGQRRERILDSLTTARNSFHWVAGDQLDVFSRWCLHRIDELVAARPDSEEP